MTSSPTLSKTESKPIRVNLNRWMENHLQRSPSAAVRFQFELAIFHAIYEAFLDKYYYFPVIFDPRFDSGKIILRVTSNVLKGSSFYYRIEDDYLICSLALNAPLHRSTSYSLHNQDLIRIVTDSLYDGYLYEVKHSIPWPASKKIMRVLKYMHRYGFFAGIPAGISKVNSDQMRVYDQPKLPQVEDYIHKVTKRLIIRPNTLNPIQIFEIILKHPYQIPDELLHCE